MKRFVVLLLISFFAFSGSYASAYAQQSVTSRPTPDQMKEFFAQIESGRITKEKLQVFLQTDSTTAPTNSATTNESAARDIMGDDIIFPEEVAKARGLPYTEAQLKQLSDTVPTAEVLRWGKEKGYALMPSPPKAMSLYDVYVLKVLKGGDLNGDELGRSLASDDKTTFGWLMIKKTPVDGSTNKNLEEQDKLLSEVERVPNVAEMGWFITTFYEVRGVRLFEGYNFVRTSSHNLQGDRVSVGHFDAKGLGVISFVGDHGVGIRYALIGLSSARKLP